jgi:hypothetical protein
MGGRGSKPRPPPPPPRPIIEFYYKYFDIPADGDRRIRDLNAEQDRKIAQRNQLQRELDVIIRKLASETEQMYYWLDLKTKRQNEIDKLNTEIADLKEKIKDLQDKIDKAKQAYKIATEQANAAGTAATALAAQDVDAIYKNLDAKAVYQSAVQIQNQYIIDQYTDYKSDLIKGDVLSADVFGREVTYAVLNKILFIFYFVLFAVLVYVFFVIKKNLSISYRIAILVVVAIYPFFVMLVERYAYDLILYLYSLVMAEPYKRHA